MSKETNIFENSYTKLYDKVYELQTPKEYIYYENVDGEDVFISFEQIFNENKESSLLELYNKYGKNLKFKLFLYAYFYFNYIQDQDKVQEYFDTINSTINEYIENFKNETGKIGTSFSPFNSINELLKDISLWFSEYKKHLESDLIIREKIVNIQNKLLEYEPVKNEGVNIEKMTFEFSPNIDIEREDRGKKKLEIKPEDVERIGILIFNDMKCSPNVPYIQFNNNNKEKYYKLYDSDDNIIDSNKFVDQSVYIDDKLNTFFVKVLDPDYIKFIQNEDKESIKKSSYIDCRYNLTKNRLDFTTTQVNQKRVKNILTQSYSLFNIGLEKRRYNIQANLTIKNFTIKPEVLHFMILNEAEIYLETFGLINIYFFMDETNKTIADKDLFEIKYKSLSNDEEDETSTADLPSSLTVKIGQEGEDLYIRIIKAMNNKVLGQFLEIFPRFLNIYKEYEEGISSIIDEYIPIEEVEDFEEESGKKDKTEKKVKQLRESFATIPGIDPKKKNMLFTPGTTGYTRICECKKQPIILDSVEDMNDWKTRRFMYKNELIERQVGTFPPVEGKALFNFVCPEDDYPFPSVAKNNDANKVEYPYVPCCAKTDEINNDNSNYNNYYENKSEKDKDNPNKSYKLNTMKSLEDNREGEIPKQIQNLLDCKDKDDTKFKYARIGFGKSKNTLIHCILRAVKDPKYMELLEDTKAKEKYCNNIRRNIPNLLPNFYEVCKQENYNKDKEYIQKEILNVEKNFKSELYYRLLEEIYNVNIFIILHRESMSNKELKNEDPAIEIPNHILTHIRPFRSDRYTIVILKHMGGEMENLKTPLYDLIFDTGILVKNEKGLAIRERVFLFDENINDILYQSYINYNKGIVFNISQSIVEARDHPYSRIYWPEIFKDFKILSQTIDANGKCRSLNLEYTSKKLGEIKITVYIPPSQPIDVPEDETVYESIYDIILSIFGTPSKENKDGLWYRALDMEYAIFIPCNTNSDEKWPESPLPSKDLMVNNPIIKFRNSRKYTNMLLECIIWGLRSNGILNLEDYLDNYEEYIVLDENVRPNIPPFKIRSYIKENGNFRDLFNIWPEYFTNTNKVKLYPELYDKVVKYLENYYKDTDGLSLPPIPYLSDVFKYEWDFSHKDITNRILIGEEQLKQWIKLRENTYKGEIQIYKEICKEKIENENDIPFIFEYQKKLFLIQQVKEGNFNRALNCGHTWNKKKFNKGFDSPDNPSNEFIPHIIYEISLSYQLFLNDNSVKFGDKENVDKYVSLINLSGKYLAMLEL